MPKGPLDWLKNSACSSWSCSLKTLDEPREEMRKRARRMSRAGVDLAMMGGCHYVWDFVEFFDRIDAYYARACEICHEFGIKVMAHHSAILSARVRSKSDYASVPREHSVPRPPLLGEPLWIDGADASEWSAVNARTGRKNYFDGYRALVYCPNNPDFQRAYEKRVRRLLAAGIDGLMSDDYGMCRSFETCACDACRELFPRVTGYDFPAADDESFWRNYDNPAWRAWLAFRWWTASEQLKRVKRMLGPGRALATCSNGCTSGYNHFSGTPSYVHIRSDLDLCTREATFSVLPFYSWSSLAGSFAVDQAFCRRSGTVFMPLLYPTSKDYIRLAMGLSAMSGGRLWNQGLPSPRKGSPAKWQKDHAELFPAGEADAQVGLAFSESTQLHRGHVHSDRYHNEWMGWAQCLLERNLPFRVLTDADLDEGAFAGLDVIALPNTACMSDRTAESLRRFHANGGRVVLSHEAGLYDEHGRARGEFALAKLMGASYQTTMTGVNIPYVFETPISGAQAHGDYFAARGDEPLLEGLHYTADHWPDQVLVTASGRARTVAVLKIPGYDIKPALLEGPSRRVLYLSGRPGNLYWRPILRIVTYDGEQASVMRDPRDERYGVLMANCVRAMMGKRPILLVDGDGWYVRRFTRPGRVVVHVMNVAGADVPEGAPLPGRAELLGPGARLPVPTRGRSLVLRLRLPKKLARCRLYRIGADTAEAVRLGRAGDMVRLRVPAERIGLHAVLEFSAR